MFKVGDKVRRKLPGFFVYEAGKKMIAGEEYTVSESRDNVIELVGFGNFTFNAHCFELVKESVVETSKKTPHKYAAVIKAWADGHPIEFRLLNCEWRDLRTPNPIWYEDTEYRIKPEPKPDVVKYGIATLDVNNRAQVQYLGPFNSNNYNNIVLTFDGETGKLKKAEVI